MSQPDALEQARQLFAGSGLPLPYIPPEMAGDIRQVGEWVYGTRSDEPYLYHLPGFAAEVGTKPVADYLLFGQSGHGINSWAMHYYLVRGPLALFVQEGWGGAYGDRAEDSRTVAERFRQAETLVHAVNAAWQRGAFQPDERLVVIASSFTGSSWRRCRGLAANDLAFYSSPDWRTQEDVFPAVLQALHNG